MSLILTGNPSHVTTPLQATVTALSANGAGEIRVTCAAPHLFGDGDTVLLRISTGTAYWQIAVIDSLHFDLVGSTFSATDTGIALDVSLTPAVQVPTDGDPFSLQLSGMLSAQQAVLDRTQYLAGAMPQGTSFTFLATDGLHQSTILSVTSNGPPCELQTAIPHALQTGLWVLIEGAAGDTAINGYWPVTVVDSTHFSIPVTGAGTYTSSSAVVNAVVPPGVTAIVADGWGGGGGGEGGGGSLAISDSSGAFTLIALQGGGGSGSPRTTRLIPVMPLQILAMAGGAGGTGGAGGQGNAVDATTQGADGSRLGLFVDRYPNQRSYFFPGGHGAGGGHLDRDLPYPGDAVVAPGAYGETSGSTDQFLRPWPFVCGVPGVYALYRATSIASNVGTFLDQPGGAGGAAVTPISTSGNHPSSPSTGGQARGGFAGGAPGSRGSDYGSAPTYLGGAGGGGGGAGPGGSGGAGGGGSNAATSNTADGSPGASATTGGTGAGGGGGGTAGAGASAPIGKGGAGGAGDCGQLTIYWVA